MIAFLAAERRELIGLERHLEDRSKLASAAQYAVWGKLDGVPVTLAANGPGPNLAKAALETINVSDLEIIVSVGFCGALSPDLSPADIFVATSVNGTPVPPPAATPPSARGALLSTDRVATCAAEKAKLRVLGAQAIEMEAAGVLERARQAGVPFHCIRVVTDASDESFGIDFNQMRDSSGRFSRPRIALRALSRPFRLIPELIQLDRRCRTAAFVLGDFIADCKF